MLRLSLLLAVLAVAGCAQVAPPAGQVRSTHWSDTAALLTQPAGADNRGYY